MNKEPSPQQPLLISKRDAARLLSISVRTVENLLACKELPCRHIGRRVLIPSVALVSFASQYRKYNRDQ